MHGCNAPISAPNCSNVPGSSVPVSAPYSQRFPRSDLSRSRGGEGSFAYLAVNGFETVGDHGGGDSEVGLIHGVKP